MRLGIVLDKGSSECRHQSLASICGFEYCLNCDYKFIGHCSSCEKRPQTLIKFFGLKKAEEIEKQING